MNLNNRILSILPIILGLGGILVLLSCSNEAPYIVCKDCDLMEELVASVKVEGRGIPWRNPPAHAFAHPRVEGNLLTWDDEGFLRYESMEIIVDVDGEKRIVAILEEPPFEISAGMDVLGVRPRRGERVGRIHYVNDPEAAGSDTGEATISSALNMRKAKELNSSEKSDIRREVASTEDLKRIEPLDDLLTRRFSHSCLHAADRPFSTHSLATDGLVHKRADSWRLDSIDTHMRIGADGLEARAELVLESIGASGETVLLLVADSVYEIETQPEYFNAEYEDSRLTITFDPPLDPGSQVDIEFSYTLQDFHSLGIDPSVASILYDAESSNNPRLFFFTGLVNSIPSPGGGISLDAPLTLTLELPDSWSATSNLVREDEDTWTGRVDLGRGRVAVAAGAYESASALTSDGIPVRVMALPDEEGNTGDLDDYAASNAAVLDFYSRWGGLTQREVAVAAVSPEHGGSASYGLVLSPDYVFHADRSRGRDFFLAHELSHQWWGGVVWPADRLDMWLTEGLADYSALRALEVIRDPADAEIVWDENLEMLIRLMEEGYGGNPGRDVPVRPESSQDLQDYVFYLKGSWVLRRLDELIGRESMDAALSAYYRDAMHGYAGTQDFLDAVQIEIQQNLDWFWDQWLSGTGLPEIVLAIYFNPGDPSDFELIISQVGDEPHSDTPWRLALHVRAGSHEGWVCARHHRELFVSEEIKDAVVQGVCFK